MLYQSEVAGEENRLQHTHAVANPYDDQDGKVVQQSEVKLGSRMLGQEYLDTDKIRINLYELCKNYDSGAAVSLSRYGKHKLFFDELLASKIVVVACAMLVPIQTVVTGKCKTGKSTIIHVGRMLERRYSVSNLLFSKEQLTDTYRSVFNEHTFYLSSA